MIGKEKEVFEGLVEASQGSILPGVTGGASGGIQSQTHQRLIPVSELLATSLRPRLQARKPGGTVALRNAYYRIIGVYDGLRRLANDGYLTIVPPSNPAELSIDLNDVFRKAYGMEPPFTKPHHVPNFYVVDNHLLQDIIRNATQYFGVRFGEPESSEPAPRKISPEYLNLANQLQRSVDYLMGKRIEEDPKLVLKDLLEAYYAYASKFRGLPKPRV